MMKILLAGSWRWYQYEEGFSEALRIIGCYVVPFKIDNYHIGFFGKAQAFLPFPSLLQRKINDDLIKCVKKERPDVFFCWRCLNVLPETIKKIKRLGIKTVSYNNDDPFGPINHIKVPWQHNYMWYWYLKSLLCCDMNFFYRSVNVADAHKYGVRHADLMMPYYIPWKDRPIVLNDEEKEKYSCDFVFIGHYEPDDRFKYIKILVDMGYRVKIYGDKYWDRKALGSYYEYFGQIESVYGDEYIKALTGAKICLSFLSKINRDIYTRRSFEIPASNNLMLSYRTSELEKIFIDNLDAVYFSDINEFVIKANQLMGSDLLRKKIAENGYKKIISSRHDIISRASEFIEKIS